MDTVYPLRCMAWSPQRRPWNPQTCWTNVWHCDVHSWTCSGEGLPDSLTNHPCQNRATAESKACNLRSYLRDWIRSSMTTNCNQSVKGHPNYSEEINKSVPCKNVPYFPWRIWWRSELLSKSRNGIVQDSHPRDKDELSVGRQPYSVLFSNAGLGQVHRFSPKTLHHLARLEHGIGLWTI